VHSSTNATEGGLIRLTETYASPYMKGDIRAAWPLHAVTDVGPLGHDLTNNNAVTFTNDEQGSPTGSYANFDGVDQSLSVADHADWTPAAGQTLAAWVYRDSDTGGNEAIVGQYDLSVAADQEYLLYYDASGETVNYATRFDTGGFSVAGPTLALSTWYYVVGVWNSTEGNIYIYVNGVLVGTTVCNGTAGTDEPEELIIGAANSSGTHASFWDGRIGGVSVSSTAMTEREIKAEYARGVRRMNSTIDTNDTISDNDVAAIAADPNGKYVAVMGDDKVCYVFDEFAVPVATDAYPGTTARDVAIKSMPGGVRHLIMAGSDQIELVQPDTKIGI